MEQQVPPSPRRAPERQTGCEVPPGLHGAVDLDALLRGVEGLRRVLETDLSLVAAATQAGALEVALDVVDADREELALFWARALGRPGGTPTSGPRPEPAGS